MTFAQMWEHMQTILAVLAALGIVVDLTPGIKIQPVRWAIRQTGNLMNHDLKKQLDEVEKNLSKVEKDLQEYKVESWHAEILDFANSCMNHRRHTQEEFHNFFKAHDNYQTYIKENELENGSVDVAFEYVSKIYLHCMETNDFLADEKTKKEGDKNVADMAFDRVFYYNTAFPDD